MIELFLNDWVNVSTDKQPIIKTQLGWIRINMNIIITITQFTHSATQKSSKINNQNDTILT